MENSPFFLKGDKWGGVGMSTDEDSKMVQTGLPREERHLVTRWGKAVLAQKSQ